MKKIFKLFTLLLCLSAHAQDDSTKPGSVQFKLGINANSRIHYLGRTDEVQSSALFPLAELWMSEKFYINAAPVFISNSYKNMDYAGTVATAGFQHIGEQWIAHLFLTKPFYEPGAALVQGTLKAQTGLSITKRSNFLNLTLGGDLKFTDATDIGATAGLDHIFRFESGRGKVWVINPSFFAFGGTQRFSSSFIRNKPGGLLNPPTQELVTKENMRFNLLALEASLPLYFMTGPWTLTLSPAYVIPQNLQTVSNRPDLSEKGESMFYATAGLKYHF